jgi:Rho-binding antiterminator
MHEPIDCGLHDRLEALATLGRAVDLAFRAEDGTRHGVRDRLVDVYASGGAEYVRTGAGRVIRLDRLDEVDGVPYGRRSGPC